VTAEFAVALPAVMSVIAIIIGIGQWQLQQHRLVVGAATIARAIARGEEQALVDEFVGRLGAQLETSFGSNLVCARLSQASEVLGLASFGAIEVSEEQCAAKQ
jgi:Flp pilus assembly protein TadG